MTIGRPTKYTKSLGELICDLIATTPRGLDFICRGAPDLPSARTVTRWLGAREPFRQSYAHARELQADLIFDECLEIADHSAGDVTYQPRGPEGRLAEVIHTEVVLRSKLRVDTRLKVAAQLNPKKYGVKLDLTGELAVRAVVRDAPLGEDEWALKHAPR